MEAPHLSRITEQFRDKGLVVLAVNAWDESRETVRRFVTEKNLKQRVLLDGSSVHESYGLAGIPVSVWIDRAGVVADVEFGYSGPTALERTTKRLIDGG